MAPKKTPKGVYVLFAFWGFAILYMVYTLGYTSVADNDDGTLAVTNAQSILKTTKLQASQKELLIAENSAMEKILVTGEIINKGVNSKDDDHSGWYHVIHNEQLYICKVYLDDKFDDAGENLWTECFTSIN